MEDLAKWLSVMTFIGGVIWYFLRINIEKDRNRRALAIALMTEIIAMKNVYKSVELKPWQDWTHNNVQSIEENYTIIYDTSSNKIALFEYEDITEIVELYTLLKAHLDTLRVLARLQKTYYASSAIIKIFSVKESAKLVRDESFDDYKSTHAYALDSQKKLYGKMEIVLNKNLSKYDEHYWHEKKFWCDNFSKICSKIGL